MWYPKNKFVEGLNKDFGCTLLQWFTSISYYIPLNKCGLLKFLNNIINLPITNNTVSVKSEHLDIAQTFTCLTT